MRAPLLCLPVTVALAALLAACGDAQEVTTPAATPVATASPAPTTAPATAQPTPSASPSVTPTPPPAPADWLSFAHPAVTEIAFRYPPEWYQSPDDPATVTSWDPAGWEALTVPPGGAAVGLDRYRLDDPALEPRPTGATNLIVAGAPAWETIDTDTFEHRAAKVHVIAIETKGYRYYLTAAFGEAADETVFSLIVGSVTFR